MKNTKNKILALLIACVAFVSNSAFADINKDAVLSSINSSISSLENSKTGTGEMLNLKNTVYSISDNFSLLYSSIGIDDAAISYLVSMGKISSDYKKDLFAEYLAIKSDVDTKYQKDLSSLNSLKDEINISYTTLTSLQKQTYLEKISIINLDVLSINSYLTTKTSELKTKYTNILNNAKTNLKSIYTANTGDLSKVSSFSSKFSDLSSKKESLDKNYSSFSTYYLGGNLAELTTFLSDKKIHYSALMKTQLQKMLDSNKEVNPGLGDYNRELSDYITFLSNKFDLELQKNLDDNYSIIYSQTKKDNIDTTYNDLKSKYTDLNLEVKASSLLADYTGAISHVNNLSSEIISLNTKLENLSVSGSVNISNVKITLENQIIVYFNNSFATYKTNLLAKMKEKLEDLSVVNDLINTKYDSYKSDIATDSTDLNYNNKTNDFKAFLGKYEDSLNDTIRKKVAKIQYSLESGNTVRELALVKYKIYSKKRTSYEEQIQTAMISLDTKLGEKFLDRTNLIFDRIDKLLVNTKLSLKNRHTLLVIKLAIRDYIYKNKM